MPGLNTRAIYVVIECSLVKKGIPYFMFANDSILVYVYECPYYMKGSNLKLEYCGKFMMLQMNRVTSLDSLTPFSFVS